MTFRRLVFWAHLAAGVVCGTVIGLMALTGAAVAFDAQITAFATREVARVTPSESPRVPLDALVKSVRERNPDTAPSGVVVYSDPAAATHVMMGKGVDPWFANPYTGELKAQNAAGVRAFLKTALELHRWLALGGDGKAVGQAVTGACALAFLFLSLSGLWLWWPRGWSMRRLRPSLWFVRGATGRARDWNWHNVVGFWSLPLLILLSATGVLMSYRWAGNLLYVAAGETPPPPRKPGEQESSKERVAPPSPEAKALPLEALLAVAQKEIPAWESISLRLPAGMSNRRRKSDTSSPGAQPEAGETPRAPGRPPVTVMVRRGDVLPLVAMVTLTLDPFTGGVMKREAFADKSAGAKLRGSVRGVHTGEGFGVPGRVVSLLGALAAMVLVFTGLALAWRRFFPGKTGRHHQHRDDGFEPPVFATGHESSGIAD